MQKLERAFRDLAREAPEYDLLAVRALNAVGQAAPPAAPNGMAVASPSLEGRIVDPDTHEDAPALLPPGPLASVEIRPVRPRVERGGRRALRARATDGAGVRITQGVSYSWSLLEGAGSLEPPDGAQAVFVAGSASGRARVAVVACADGRDARAEAEVAIVDTLPESGPRAGIPEPAFVEDTRGEWRSRLTDGRWEVNSGHRDFVAATAGARRKLRYLAALLAKEVVIHSYPVP